MSDAVARVREVLDARGVTPTVRRFDAPVASAAAAAAELGCEVGAIANSLVFDVDDTPLLVLTSGAHRVDVAALARARGVGRKRVRVASPEFVARTTGQRAGGVAPVGHPRPIPTLVDPWLQRHPVVWASAGDAHTVFATTAADLVALTGGTVADVGRAQV